MRNPLAGCAALLLAAFLVLCGPGFPAAHGEGTVMEIFTLRHRPAEQVMPVIEPLLAPGGKVSGLQGQLIVRTSPGNLEEIRRVLASIDTAPRHLLVTVRQDADAEFGGHSIGVSGQAGERSGDLRTPGGGSHEDGKRLQARMLDTRSADSERTSQVLQVMEGAPAYIRIGESVPVPQRTVVGAHPGGRVVTWVTGGVEYREVGTGFYVRPMLAGDQVTLDISPRREALSGQHQGRIDVQRVATTVTGRLGEWIEVAGIASSTGGGQSVLLGHTSHRGSGARRVLVKVEEIK